MATLRFEPIPPETAQVAHAAFPKGNQYLRVAANVVATCGKVSDHMVRRAADVYATARPVNPALGAILKV